MSHRSHALSARKALIVLVSVVIAAPAMLVAYQGLLDQAFFDPRAVISLQSLLFVLTDPQFWEAFRNSIFMAAGALLIGMPLGMAFAILIVRTDLPAKRTLAVCVLVPVFLSPVLLSIGYLVTLGPVGIVSTTIENWFGVVPWSISSLGGITVLSALGLASYVYLYAAAALRMVASDVDEAARTCGATPLRSVMSVTLPLIRPSILAVALLVFVAAIEMFGLPLILGEPSGLLTLSVYLYKLSSMLGKPAYHLMASITLIMMALIGVLIFLQRRILSATQRYVTIRGKASRQVLIGLGRYRWPAAIFIGLWFLITVGFPIFGLVIRSLVNEWGGDTALFSSLTLDHYRAIFTLPGLSNSILNTTLLATVGGFISVAVYFLIGLLNHRLSGRWGGVLDYASMAPRTMPGLMLGLSIFWLFLFIPFLFPLKNTLVSLWIAYTIVWVSYGLRLVNSSLNQVPTEMEEAAKIAGASAWMTIRTVTGPLVKYGLLSAWLLIFLTFAREYASAVYLISPGNEVIGGLLVIILEQGSVAPATALAVVNIGMIGIGLFIALKAGVNLHD